MNKKRLGKFLVLVGGIGLLVNLFYPVNTAEPPTVRTACKVLMVFDGDTIGCDLNADGRLHNPSEHIRLLGIDTPEMSYSKRNKAGVSQPWAEEGTALVKNKLLNHNAYLEWDEQRKDQYGRPLAYVFPTADAMLSINEELLEAGLAYTLFIPPNRKYETRFEEASARARTARRALWQP